MTAERLKGIRILRDGKKVTAQFDTGLPITTSSIPLSYGCSDEFDATLLQRYLSEALRKTTRDLIRKAYELGWKDAKGKKRGKRKYFTTQLNTKDSVAW